MKPRITPSYLALRLAPLLIASALNSTIAHADDGDLFIEEVTIIGEKVTGDQISGSAHYIGTEE